MSGFERPRKRSSNKGQARKTRQGWRKGGGAAVPLHQIFAKIYILPIDHDSKNKKIVKKYVPL